MRTFKVSIQKTSNDSILKFELNEFITKHQSFEFNNIYEAATSPLAKHLFSLPFVKKVYITSNFVAIERYDMVKWRDVQDELAIQIETYLNDGGIVIEDSENTKKIAITVYAESTPNPSVLKFVANKKIVPSVFEFTSIDDSKPSPLATKLFHFPFVKSIFMDENYISITKYDIAEWEDITVEIREFIKSFIESGEEIIISSAIEDEKNKTNSKLNNNIETLDATSRQIITILEEHVKPAVASDGGNIEFLSYNPENKTVNVMLQGACSGCPSSTFTLKNGIETMLKEMLQDNNIIVEAING